jgi:hypothetical protein
LRERKLTNAWTPQAENFVNERSLEGDDSNPWPDVNLDFHGDNDGGTSGYPRRLTDENFDPGGVGGNYLGHLIGDVTAQAEPSLPVLPTSKFARRDFSHSEKFELIDEEGSASNTGKLSLEGTHYVQDEEDIAFGLSLGL